jgi:hypothetical protein
VATVGTPDVDVDLHFLLAPGALVSTCHSRYRLRGLTFDCTGTVDRTEGNTEGRGLRLVCAAGELVPALPAQPDTGAFAFHGLGIALGAAVGCTRDLLHLCNALAHEAPVPAAETTGTSGYFSFC